MPALIDTPRHKGPCPRETEGSKRLMMTDHAWPLDPTSLPNIERHVFTSFEITPTMPKPLGRPMKRKHRGRLARTIHPAATPRSWATAASPETPVNHPTNLTPLFAFCLVDALFALIRTPVTPTQPPPVDFCSSRHASNLSLGRDGAQLGSRHFLLAKKTKSRAEKSAPAIAC